MADMTASVYEIAWDENKDGACKVLTAEQKDLDVVYEIMDLLVNPDTMMKFVMPGIYMFNGFDISLEFFMWL